MQITTTANATQHAQIECHENHISGPGVDYTARAWYVRLPNGKLHGQFMSLENAEQFAEANDRLDDMDE